MMRGRPGRQLARVAVGSAVAGATMGAVHHHQQKRWARQDQEAYQETAMQQQLAAQQAQIEQLQQQQQYPPPPQYAQPPQYTQPAAPPTAAESATVQRLKQLAELHSAGVLSDEEFAVAKQKVLAGE